MEKCFKEKLNFYTNQERKRRVIPPPKTRPIAGASPIKHKTEKTRAILSPFKYKSMGFFFHFRPNKLGWRTPASTPAGQRSFILAAVLLGVNQPRPER